MPTSFIVLGSGQDGGAPQLGETTLRSPRRSASSLAVISASGAVVLLDASPDIRLQVEVLLSSPLYPHGRDEFLDAVCITHAHIGHYAGLLQFGREAAATREIPLHATERFLAFVKENEPWAALLRDAHLVGVPIDNAAAVIDGDLTIAALPVPHRDEYSDTVAFSVQVRGHPWLLYLPDIDDWGAWDGAEEELARHDVALIDASFSAYDELPSREMGSIRHPLVTDTITRFRHLTTETRLILTHINHSNPLGDPIAPITDQAAAAGFRVAYDGLTISREDENA